MMDDHYCLQSLRIVLLLAVAVWASAASADELPGKPAADPARLAALVAQLGSDEFSQREAASEALLEAGLPAFGALEAAALHPDREVRYRAVRILSQIRELDLQRRLETFLSGNEGPGDYPLPGWGRFHKAYGDTSQSRQLFVDMQRADPELMQTLERDAKAAAELLGQRAQQHQEALRFAGNSRQMTLGQILTTTFVAAEDDVAASDDALSTVLSFCMHQSFREAMNNPTKREIPRKMLASIIRRSEDNAVYYAMRLATEYELEEGLVPAVKTLKQDATVPHYYMYALITVSQLGDESHLPLVEKHMNDKSVLSRHTQKEVVHELQVRDAALAAAILLTKQDLKSYYPDRGDFPVTQSQQMFFNPRLIGFPPEAAAGEDEQPKEDPRAPVYEKWRKYKARQTATKAESPGEPPPAEAK